MDYSYKQMQSKGNYGTMFLSGYLLYNNECRKSQSAVQALVTRF